MATIKIHLMLGQGLIRTAANGTTYLTSDGDPDNIWLYPNPDFLALNARVLVYDHANDQLGAGVPGVPFYALGLSNLLYNGVADPEAADTFGLDLTFLRDVAQEDSDFHCLVKLAGAGTLRDSSGIASQRWDKAGADLYADIVPAITQAKAHLEAVTGGPHDVELASIISCFGYLEAAGYATLPALSQNLANDWAQFLTDVRTDLGAVISGAATAASILYRIHSGTQVGQGGPYLDQGVVDCQNAAATVAANQANTAVLNVDGTELRSDEIFSTASATMKIGEMAADLYFRIVDPPTVVQTDGGIPVIFYVAQSNGVGQTAPIVLSAGFNADANLQPFDLSNNPKAYDDVWTFDHAQQKVVPYNPSVNSNTLPNGVWAPAGRFGPDVALVAGLRKMIGPHVLYKVAVGSMSLGPNTVDTPVLLRQWSNLVYATGALAGQPRSVWPTLSAGWKACRQSVLSVIGKVPDTRLILVHQGESDSEEALYLSYEDRLRQLIADLRALAANDTIAGAVVPAGILRTRKVPGGPFDTARTDVVRAAQQLIGAEPGNFWIDVDDLPYRTDKVHLTGEGTIRCGRRIVEKLPASFLQLCSGG